MKESEKHLSGDEGAENSGWERLAQEAQASVGWEDVGREAPSVNAAMENGDLKNRMELRSERTSLSDAELAMLDSCETWLYRNQPKVFTELWNQKSRFSKPVMKSFEEALVNYYTIDGQALPAPNQHAFGLAADLFRDLKIRSWAVDLGKLFQRDETQVNEIQQQYSLARTILFPPEEEHQKEEGRAGIIARILQKLRNRHGSETKEQEYEDNYKETFLACLVNGFSMKNHNEKDLEKLAELQRETAEDKSQTRREIMSRVIADNLGDGKEYVSILEYATMQRDLLLNDAPEVVHTAQNSVLNAYVRADGKEKFGSGYFGEKILPLVMDEKTAMRRDSTIEQLLFSRSHEGDDRELKPMMDYALEEMVPLITPENMEYYRENLICKSFEKAKTVEELVQLDHVMQDKLFQFVARQKRVSAEPHARDYAGSLAQEFWQREVDDVLDEDGEKVLDALILVAEERVMPLLQEKTTTTNYMIKRQLLNTALEKNYELEFLDYLRDTVFPMINAEDARIDDFIDGRALRGGYRIRDYEFECMTQKVSPRAINRLLMQRSELPTRSIQALEQNRIDALAIEDVVVPDHGFIHDQEPMTHDVIAAMVEYYDAANSGDDAGKLNGATERLARVLKEAQSIGRRYGGLEDLQEMAFDLKNYDRRIAGVIDDDGIAERSYNEPAIEVLRRLEKNTRLESFEVPRVANEKWRELMEAVKIRVNPENGKIRADWQSVGGLVKHANDWLVAMQEKYGIFADNMEAIAFTERAATFALRNVTEKQRGELAYDENFKEMVRFQELIGSFENYDDRKFEEFYERFRSMQNEQSAERGYEGFAYLQRRILENSRGLAKEYRKEGNPERAMRMQSGNLLHELVGLTDMRPPETLRERADYIASGQKLGES